MFTVRIASANGDRVSMKDTDYETKAEALAAIRDHDPLTSIIRLGRLYIAMPKPRKK